MFDLMRKGKTEKLMPPRILMEKAVGQTEKVEAQQGEDSPFAQPVKNFPM